MTQGERNVLDDANEFVRQSANIQSEVPETSGIRPHPLVESTEQTLDTSRFGFGFGPKPLATVEPTSGSSGTSPCPTTSQVQIVFSGVLNCGCTTNESSSSRVSEDPLPVNGTLLLDQTFSDTWDNSLQPPTTVTLLEYISTTDCSGDPSSSTEFSLEITLTCDGSGWDLQVNFSGRSFWLFRSSGSAPIPLGIPKSNEFTGGSCGPDGLGNTNYGYDGTVTITQV